MVQAIAGKLSIQGAKALERRLAKLDSKLARKTARQAVRAAAKVVLAEARNRATVDSGATRKSIKIRSGRSRKKKTVLLKVELGAGFFKGKTFYASFLEFGTSARAARPFLRPAFEAKKEAAAEAMVGVLRQAVSSP
jgi:HK97 gp10 family phage protein